MSEFQSHLGETLKKTQLLLIIQSFLHYWYLVLSESVDYQVLTSTN